MILTFVDVLINLLILFKPLEVLLAMANRKTRMAISGPDKGSFPLDHFHECEEHAIRYNACLDKHQLMPKRCQKFQINYIECRMKHGLMGKDKIENLGFTQVNTWDNEE